VHPSRVYWTTKIFFFLLFSRDRATSLSIESALLKKAVHSGAPLRDLDGFFEHGFTAHLGIDLNHFQLWSDI
jgi:hypothetical protein